MLPRGLQHQWPSRFCDRTRGSQFLSSALRDDLYLNYLPPELFVDNLTVNTGPWAPIRNSTDLRRRSMKFLKLMFLALLFASGLLSQTASLTGVVKDSTGAVWPGRSYGHPDGAQPDVPPSATKTAATSCRTCRSVSSRCVAGPPVSRCSLKPAWNSRWIKKPSSISSSKWATYPNRCK